MGWYDVLLFLHISCATVWLGAAVLLQVQGTRSLWANDREAIMRALQDSGTLAAIVFMPASMGTLLFGILLVIVGGWGFDQIWVIVGLAGVAATVAIGMGILKPVSMRLAAMVKEDGGVSERVLDGGRTLVIVGRLDILILYFIVANMALKPTLDDVTTLVAMAAVFAAGVAAVLITAPGHRKAEAMVPAE